MVCYETNNKFSHTTQISHILPFCHNIVILPSFQKNQTKLKFSFCPSQFHSPPSNSRGQRPESSSSPTQGCFCVFMSSACVCKKTSGSVQSAFICLQFLQMPSLHPTQVFKIYPFGHTQVWFNLLTCFVIIWQFVHLLSQHLIYCHYFPFRTVLE